MKFQFKQPGEFWEKDAKIHLRQSNMSGLGWKVKGQTALPLVLIENQWLSRFKIFLKYFSLNS